MDSIWFSLDFFSELLSLMRSRESISLEREPIVFNFGFLWFRDIVLFGFVHLIANLANEGGFATVPDPDPIA